MSRRSDDIRIDVTIRNNNILTRMQQMGFKTAKTLARAAGLDQSTLGRLINMTALPINRHTAEWTEPAKKLALFFRCLPEDLFSASQQSVALVDNQAQIELSSARLRTMFLDQEAARLDPVVTLEATELTEAIEEALNSLQPRERDVLMQEFGLNGAERNKQAIAYSLGVSRERVSQIGKRALRKLRDPLRSRLPEAAGVEY